jgi:hypothetical protein
MGLLDRLFGSSRGTEVAETKPPVAHGCPHTFMAPVWDSADDMGSEEKASSFTCTVCSERFSPAEAAELRASEAERLLRDLA